ncbi:PfkB [Rhodospirillum rubrum ATCC 11170]|uniref:PfkB n=2 Tax=Rhodospirillum rubrum TaxID=1085 RepID=Q2RY41_RHORT|nr:PfkB [Rhodospirillum rubrum ATCC 11170]MBK5952511.1 adenosine kinase [Rhodospirillum rubrum]HAP99076.1 adenosine kinase [Rhodospirillum rubrum]
MRGWVLPDHAPGMPCGLGPGCYTAADWPSAVTGAGRMVERRIPTLRQPQRPPRQSRQRSIDQSRPRSPKRESDVTSMHEPRFDVAGIGNAIVDVLSHADDAFLATNDLPKGGMTLIDETRAEVLYASMGPGIEASGGSAANTMAGLASLGARTAFIGKVRDDALGAIFRHDITSIGVTFPTAPLTEGPSTARCLILVTPDAERTMNTYLGACTQLAPDDIDAEVIADSAITYIEGYLWDQPAAKTAILQAAAQARKAGRKVALSLSDSFCVDRHRDTFLELVDNHVDILLANEHEVMALFGSADLDQATAALRGRCALAVVTRSAKGCRIVSAESVTDVPAETVDHLVDTTGAGDQFAAGFLFGLCRGYEPKLCARIGAIAAAEVVSHFGARPEAASLADLVKAKLG